MRLKIVGTDLSIVLFIMDVITLHHYTSHHYGWGYITSLWKQVKFTTSLHLELILSIPKG